jgi:hypothetical protein
MFAHMLSEVFAQMGHGGGSWDVWSMAKAAIIICALVAIVIVIVKVMGYTIPQWFWTIVLIVVAAFVGLVAINFLASM